MREEFYQNRDITKHCAELEDWNEELEKFIYKYNHYRPHNSLENEPQVLENKKGSLLTFLFDNPWAKFAEGKQDQMLENLMLASKFDNLCPKFAEGL